MKKTDYIFNVTYLFNEVESTESFIASGINKEQAENDLKECFSSAEKFEYLGVLI